MGGVNGILKGLCPGNKLNQSKQAKQVKGEMRKMQQNAKKGAKK